MSEENKNLNEELESAAEESAEAVETVEEAEAVEEAVEVIEEAVAEAVEETVEEIEEAEAIAEVVEAAEEAIDEIAADIKAEYDNIEEPEAEDAVLAENTSNKKVVTGVIIGVAVLVVAAIVAVFAIFGKTWFNPYERGYLNITGRTVGEVADMMGMEYSEFLESYGLPEDMPESTSENAASNSIPMGKYAELNGMELAQLIEMMGWDAEKVTTETTLGEALDGTKLSMYVGEENLPSFKEQFGFGDEVTGDTLWGEVRHTVELKQKEEYEAQQNATEEPVEEEATEEAVEENAEEAETEATEAPAE